MPRLARAALAALALLALTGTAIADPPAKPKPIVIVLDARLGDAPYWTSKGRDLLNQGKPDEALTFAVKAVAFLDGERAAEHPEPLGRALFLLAEIRETRGEYPVAAALFERLERLYVAHYGPDDIHVARALAGQGRVYAALGDYAKGLPRARRSLALAEKALAPDDPALGDYIELLGEELDESGAHDEAEPLLERALALYAHANKVDPDRLADALHNLGARDALLGATDKAIERFDRSIALRVKAHGPDNLDLAQTQQALAVLYAGKGRPADTLMLEERAVDILQRHLGPMHPELIVPLGNIALAHLDLGDPRAAEGAYARALGIAERHTTLVLATGSEREKLAFLATVSPLADSFVASVLRRYPRDPALARLGLLAVLRNKGRALDAVVDSVGLLRRHLSPGARVVLDDLHQAQTRLSALVIGGAGARDPEKSQAERSALLARIEQLEARVSEASQSFRAETHPVRIADLQTALGDDGALVEIFAFAAEGKLGGAPKYRYAAFVLRKTGDPVGVDLGEAPAIEAAIQAFHDALEDPKRDDVKALGRALDERLMRPLRPALAGVRQVFLSPDRAANLVPFEALVDEGDHALIERFSFTYLASGRDLARFSAGHAPSRGGALLLANPAFDEGPGAGPRDTPPRGTPPPGPSLLEERGYALDALGHMHFGALLGTAAEGATIAAELPGAKLLTGAEATKAALFASTGPSLLHIATHGFFLPPEERQARPGRGAQRQAIVGSDTLLRSGLAFAGANRKGEARASGILTALEATGLDLEGTRLVTLSACETGLGEIQSGDGVHGLRRALAIAGAETVVMSLWKVDDAATRDLMIAYYRRLRRGEGRSEAMRAVKLEMRSRAPTAHPYAWAGFIVSGDPSPIEGMRERSVAPVEPGRPGCACHTGSSDDAPTPAVLLGLGFAALLVTRRASGARARP
jgi:MYXO-CTERM domain-containing protein